MTDGEQVDAEKNGIRYQGKILHTDQASSSTTGLYRVEADVDLKNEVKTGSAVKVSLDTDISTIGRETEADPWESGMLEAIGWGICRSLMLQIQFAGSYMKIKDITL